MQRFSFLVGAALLVALLSGCAPEEPADQELVRPVRYQKIFATGSTRVRTFSGTAQAGEESQLSFKVGGNVQRLSVAVGDRVTAGDVIAALDANDYRLKVQEAEAALAQAQAQLRNAKSNYERVQALWENASASKQDLDSALAAFESAQAQVQTSEKRLELARLQVDYTVLTAPFTGAVADVRVEVNENVQPGSPIVILTSTGRPEVKVSIPGVLIDEISSGSPATVTFNALPDDRFSSTITEVGVAATGFATTFPVTVQLDDLSDHIRPGMAAEVSFRFETGAAVGAVIVPAVAVGEDHHGRFVFILEPVEQGMAVARRRNVQVGELTSEGLMISSGLEEGELIVTAGISRISDGQKVKLL